jgi:hypothetical protein
MMQLSQIYLSDEDSELPPFLRHCQESAQQAIAHTRYVLYDHATLRSFISQHYDGDVVAAYDKLAPYAYRSDLGRYCLLHTLGGWYIDVAIRPLLRFGVPEMTEVFAFRESNRLAGSSWGVSNGALYSKPGHAIFATAISLIVENCRNENYGFNSLCPSGPNLLGRAFALNNSVENIIFGDVMLLTPGYKKVNKSMVLPTGDIFAFFKPSAGGDLKSLGATGVNNYNELYNSRLVYKK